MAFTEIKDVRIAGIACAVPKKTISNYDIESPSTDYDSSHYVETTGVKIRHVDDDYTTSDLCYHAAEKLIADLKWEKSEIDAIVFVSQTPDYIEPATACILQDRLNLSKECAAFDISLGCSGWIYGLCSSMGMMSKNGIKKMLLMCGDAKRIFPDLNPLFGYAGSVTALEFCETAPTVMFHLGTDGSGHKAIIIPDGGARNPFSVSSLEYEIIDGQRLNSLQTHMDGMDVFSFGITTAPKSIRKLSEHFSFNYLDYDYFVFHQANLKMNDMIAKKLKLDPSKVPSSLSDYGNTSSASIPLTIVTQLKESVTDCSKLICCGFGIGLSWGTVAFELNNTLISEIVEV